MKHIKKVKQNADISACAEFLYVYICRIQVHQAFKKAAAWQALLEGTKVHCSKSILIACHAASQQHVCVHWAGEAVVHQVVVF